MAEADGTDEDGMESVTGCEVRMLFSIPVVNVVDVSLYIISCDRVTLTLLGTRPTCVYVGENINARLT